MCPTTYQVFAGVSVRYSAVQVDLTRMQYDLLDVMGGVVSTFIAKQGDASLVGMLDGLATRGQTLPALYAGGYYSGSLTYVQGRTTVTLDCVFEVDQLSANAFTGP